MNLQPLAAEHSVNRVGLILPSNFFAFPDRRRRRVARARNPLNLEFACAAA
jgi:hypothetical protein